MKLSTKSRYGLKAMFMLAKSYDETLPVSKMAKDIGASASYLDQLLRLLKNADLVTSSRGSLGGYALSREASDITVGEILRVLEDNFEIVDCIKNHACEPNCPTRVIWKKLYDAINNTLDNITLNDMVENQNLEI